MTHHRKPYESDPAGPGPQNAEGLTRLEDEQVGLAEGDKGGMDDRQTDQMSPFLRLGPSWAEIRTEWQRGSRVKVVVWFAMVSFFGWCCGREISRILI